MYSLVVIAREMQIVIVRVITTESECVIVKNNRVRDCIGNSNRRNKLSNRNRNRNISRNGNKNNGTKQ